MCTKRRIFISYAQENLTAAQRLHEMLKRAGMEPWLAVRDLVAGQQWKLAIRNAIRESDYFVALLSEASLSKRGFVQKELKQALDVLDEVPESDIYLIPMRLDDCAPSNPRLKDLQWVDLFPYFERGVNELLTVVLPRTDPNPEVKVDIPQQRTTTDHSVAPSATLLSSDEPTAFGIRIRGHRVEMRFDSLPLEHLECEPWVEDIQPLTGELLTAQKLYTRARQKLAHRKGQAFDNNALFGASNWRVVRPDASGSRRRSVRLGFRRICYFDHVFLSHALNDDISAWFRTRIHNGELDDADLLEAIETFITSHRSFVPAKCLGIPADLTLAHARMLPMLPFRIGLGITIVTGDNRVIVPLRSSQVDLRDIKMGTYSTSVGEAMAGEDTIRGLHRARLESARRRRGIGQVVPGEYGERHRPAAPQESDVPSFVAFAARALLDEMGIEDQVHCEVARDVLCVALNFDRREAVPYLSAVLKTGHTFDQISELARRKAKDGWENERLLGLPWEEKTAKELFTGEIEVPDGGSISAACRREQVCYGQAWEAFCGA